MKKTVSKILVLVVAAAVAFTVVHFAVLGNNTPTDTEFTFAVEDGNAILTGSTDTLSGAVMLPDSIGGHTVVGIGENAFKDCADVTAFFLPDTITSIGAYAFENCTGLKQAILPSGLVSIGEGAFWKCSGLVSMTVPASVTSIGSCAFYKCDAMESLVVPGAGTPVKGAFNVALDIGQTLAIGNPARYALDPVTTTVYCYKDSAAYIDALQDAYCSYALLEDGSENADCNWTSYTVRYTDVDGNDVADPVTLSIQPIGIRVAAVATIPEDEELAYPEESVQEIELSADAANNTMTFVYNARTYTVTYDPDGGEELEPLVYTTTDETALGTTTRFGYTLTGWVVAQEADDAHYNWGDPDTPYLTSDVVTGKFGDVTLKAVWEPVAITVTYDAQGGEADAESTLVEFAGTYGELANATREGYTFDGWYSSDGVRIEPETTVTTVENHTLFAKWSINKYDVTVITDGNGTAGADLTTDVEYGTLVTLTAEADKGYAFLAWESDEVTVADNTFSMPDTAVAVKATFAPVEYTVTFDTDGGDAKDALPYTITDSTALGTATKTGFTFFCWKVSVPDGNWGNAGSVYSAGNTVNGKYGNVTLKASWKANTMTVTYDAQGGTASVASKNVTFGGTYGTLATATREGYTFEGWYTTESGGVKIEPTTTVTEIADHTIYAYWTINKYTVMVSTDNNGFAEADATEDVAYGTLVTLTATAKPGFTFTEWVSSDVTVNDNTFTMPDKAVQLRATFTPVEYTITFDTDGGDAKQPLTYKTTDGFVLGDATKAGYTFAGWQVTVPAESGDYNWGSVQKAYSADQTVRGRYGDVTLKAVWTGNTLTVTYDAQNGTAGAESTAVTVGSAYGTLANAVREGYTFDGWFTDATDGTEVTAETIVTETADHTLFAHWTINKYNVTVTTDGNGTASADLTEDVAYGTVVTLTTQANEGYTFLAWESSAVTVADNAFSMPDSAVTVNATFSANHYTIAFDASGVEQTMDAVDAQYDADVELPACTFERTGFAFLGWALTEGAETPDFEDAATVKNLTATADETVTLYAVWQDIQVELIAKEGSTTVIDPTNNFIYGLQLGIKKSELLNDYLDVIGNGRLVVVGDTIGTGTVVELYNDNTGELVDSYTLILFGDVSGDGIINSTDVTSVRNMNARLEDYDLSNPYAFAANVNPDTIINSSDVTTIRMLSAKIAEIDQVTREVS